MMLESRSLLRHKSLLICKCASKSEGYLVHREIYKLGVNLRSIQSNPTYINTDLTYIYSGKTYEQFER